MVASLLLKLWLWVLVAGAASAAVMLLTGRLH
jgi:hypothetical protein